jgi:hypothetical protein
MAIISIQNNGASFKIIKDGVSRLVAKSQVREISVVQTYFVKIDVGLGALHNIHIDERDVTTPVTANAEALRDQLNSWMDSGSVTVSGGATEAMQDSQQTELEGLNTKLITVQTKLDSVNSNLQTDRYLEFPLMVDENTPGVIYKGFAAPGSSPTANVWAIQKITVDSGVTQLQWANGVIAFTEVWNDRLAIGYS